MAKSKNYNVVLKSAPKGHCVPTLLREFGAWLARQPYGSVGYFELIASPVRGGFGDADAATLARDAWCFADLPDGAMLALLSVATPAPVVLFSDDADIRVVAPSLEAFLIALATRKTRIDDLDDAKNATALSTWLAGKQVKAPTAAKFNLRTYLKQARPIETAESKKQPPNVRALLALLGQPMAAVPTKLKNAKGLQFRERKGIIDQIVMKEGYSDKLPFKLEFGVNKFTTKTLLGPSKSEGKAPNFVTTWEKPIDKARGIYFVHTRGHFVADPTVYLEVRR